MGVWTWVILFLLLAVPQLLSDLPHLLLADVVPDSVHGSIAAKLPEVTARVTLRLLRNLLQINGVAQLSRKNRKAKWDTCINMVVFKQKANLIFHAGRLQSKSMQSLFVVGDVNFYIICVNRTSWKCLTAEENLCVSQGFVSGRAEGPSRWSEGSAGPCGGLNDDSPIEFCSFLEPLGGGRRA